MTVAALLSLLIWLVIVGLIFYVIWWGIGKIGLPEPFNKIALAILIIVIVVVLVQFLLGLGVPKLG